MKIQATVLRAYVGAGLTGTNGRYNGKNVVHVRAADSEVLRDIDGDHQAGGGEIRCIVDGEESIQKVIGQAVTVDLGEAYGTPGKAMTVKMSAPEEEEAPEPEAPPPPAR